MDDDLIDPAGLDSCRLVVVLDQADPPAGRIGVDDDRMRSFAGWVGLAAALHHYARPMTESQGTEVTNNVERSRFEIHVEDGRLAGFAQYRSQDGVREFFHTVVKDEFEGQGIGGRLVRAALDQTRADGLKVIDTCPFFKAWIGKHPDYQDLLSRAAD